MDVDTNITRVDGPAPRYVVPSRGDRADGKPVERPRAEEKPPPARDGREPDLKFTLRTVDADARFSIHEATRSVIVTIVDRRTGEVIREIPSRRYLDLVAAISGKGTILDEKR